MQTCLSFQLGTHELSVAECATDHQKMQQPYNGVVDHFQASIKLRVGAAEAAARETSAAEAATLLVKPKRPRYQ